MRFTTTELFDQFPFIGFKKFIEQGPTQSTCGNKAIIILVMFQTAL
jgi:hypothetical protein